MQLNDIEKYILKHFFSNKGVSVGDNFFSSLNIISRELSGVGFLTELEKSVELKAGKETETYKFGDLGATINASIETGYLMYIENGFLDAIEGYTYSENWPEEVNTIEFYSNRDKRY